MQLKEVIHTITIYVEQEIDGKNIIKIGPGDSLCENGKKLFFKKEYYFNGDCFVLFEDKSHPGFTASNPAGKPNRIGGTSCDSP